jgi:hypothetical protein
MTKPNYAAWDCGRSECVLNMNIVEERWQKQCKYQQSYGKWNCVAVTVMACSKYEWNSERIQAFRHVMKQILLIGVPCEVCEHCSVLAFKAEKEWTVYNCCLFLTFFINP